MASWTLPSAEELDALLALTLVQRGARLLEMTPARRLAYAVAYAKREGAPPYRICDRFDTWQQLYLNTLQHHTGAHR
jgi:hypothetical protein